MSESAVRELPRGRRKALHQRTHGVERMRAETEGEKKRSQNYWITIRSDVDSTLRS